MGLKIIPQPGRTTVFNRLGVGVVVRTVGPEVNMFLGRNHLIMIRRNFSYESLVPFLSGLSPPGLSKGMKTPFPLH